MLEIHGQSALTNITLCNYVARGLKGGGLPLFQADEVSACAVKFLAEHGLKRERYGDRPDRQSGRTPQAASRSEAEAGEAETTRGPTKSNDVSRKGYSQALKISSEFISAIVVGGLIGYLLDCFLPTKPWGLLSYLSSSVFVRVCSTCYGRPASTRPIRGTERDARKQGWAVGSACRRRMRERRNVATPDKVDPIHQFHINTIVRNSVIDLTSPMLGLFMVLRWLSRPCS